MCHIQQPESHPVIAENTNHSFCHPAQTTGHRVNTKKGRKKTKQKHGWESPTKGKAKQNYINY